MAAQWEVRVPPADAGMRLDNWLRARHPQLAYATVQKWLRQGRVRIGGARAANAHRLVGGEMVRLPGGSLRGGPLRGGASSQAVPPVLPESVRTEMRNWVLYKDADMLALNKPPGLAVQGGSKMRHHLDRMLDALRFDMAERPRLVHRLDKATSGLLLLARHRQAAQTLTRAFAAQRIRKLYWGLVQGRPRPAAGEIVLALRKHPEGRGAKASGAGRARMRPAAPQEADAKRARTRYRVCKQIGSALAFVAFSPLTGRTHQIRAHAAAQGWPLLGDDKYGQPQDKSAPPGLGAGLHLHARALKLPQAAQALIAPLPPHMQQSWDALGLCARGGEDWLEEAGA